jgi:hypothetical protein
MEQPLSQKLELKSTLTSSRAADASLVPEHTSINSMAAQALLLKGPRISFRPRRGQ